MDWFNDLPELLQLAIALGLSIAVAGGGGSIIWVRFGGMAKKIDDHTEQIAHAETLRITMQTAFDTKLKEKETEFSKQVADAKEAFNTQLEIKQKEFTQQLEAVANNFARQKAEHDSEIAKKDTVITDLTTAKASAETERDELKKTIENLNDRIDDIQGQLREQATKISDLQSTLNEKNKKEKEMGEMLTAFKSQVAVLNDEKQIWIAEKKIVMDIFDKLGLKLKAIEEKSPAEEIPQPTQEINAT